MVVVAALDRRAERADRAVRRRCPRSARGAIIVAQHMPERFTRTFAERLDKQGSFRVSEAEHGAELAPHTAFVCPGGRCVELERRGQRLVARVVHPAAERPLRAVRRSPVQQRGARLSAARDRRRPDRNGRRRREGCHRDQARRRPGVGRERRDCGSLRHAEGGGADRVCRRDACRLPALVARVRDVWSQVADMSRLLVPAGR